MWDLMLVNVAYAESVDSFIANVNRMIVNPLILLLFALAVAYFLYGALQFFMSGQSDEKKTAGKQHMIWGIIGMTIMMGVFFLMNLILNTIGVEGIKPETNEVELNLDYNPTYPPRDN